MNVFRMNCHHFLFQMRHQEALSRPSASHHSSSARAVAAHDALPRRRGRRRHERCHPVVDPHAFLGRPARQQVPQASARRSARAHGQDVSSAARRALTSLRRREIENRKGLGESGGRVLVAGRAGTEARTRRAHRVLRDERLASVVLEGHPPALDVDLAPAAIVDVQPVRAAEIDRRRRRRVHEEQPRRRPDERADAVRDRAPSGARRRAT